MTILHRCKTTDWHKHEFTSTLKLLPKMTKITLNTVVVEDSETQRAVITKLAKDNPHLNVVGDYANGILALNAIKKTKVDLILLDIVMPVVNGFDLLDYLEKPPQIILWLQ